MKFTLLFLWVYTHCFLWNCWNFFCLDFSKKRTQFIHINAFTLLKMKKNSRELRAFLCVNVLAPKFQLSKKFWHISCLHAVSCFGNCLILSNNRQQILDTRLAVNPFREILPFFILLYLQKSTAWVSICSEYIQSCAEGPRRRTAATLMKKLEHTEKLE